MCAESPLSYVYVYMVILWIPNIAFYWIEAKLYIFSQLRHKLLVFQCMGYQYFQSRKRGGGVEYKTFTFVRIKFEIEMPVYVYIYPVCLIVNRTVALSAFKCPLSCPCTNLNFKYTFFAFASAYIAYLSYCNIEKKARYGSHIFPRNSKLFQGSEIRTYIAFYIYTYSVFFFIISKTIFTNLERNSFKNWKCK